MTESFLVYGVLITDEFGDFDTDVAKLLNESEIEFLKNFNYCDEDTNNNGIITAFTVGEQAVAIGIDGSNPKFKKKNFENLIFIEMLGADPIVQKIYEKISKVYENEKFIMTQQC